MEEKKEDETGTSLFHQFAAQRREPEEDVVCVKLIKWRGDFVNVQLKVDWSAEISSADRCCCYIEI